MNAQIEYEKEIPHLNNEEYLEDIKLSDDDETLAGKIRVRMEEGQQLQKKICEEAKDAVKMFRGEIDEIDESKSNKYKSRAVLSRIYLTIRNMVGMATDKPPSVEIVPQDDNPKTLRKVKAIEANIEWQMIENDFNGQLAMALFDAWIKRDSFLHWFWDYEKNDLGMESLPLEDITVAKGARSIQDAEYVIYHPWKNRVWWRENYKEHYNKIKFCERDKEYDAKDSKERGIEARFIQYWENDILVEKVQGKDGKYIILRKTQNPYFEYRDPETQKNDLIKEANGGKAPNILQRGVNAVKNLFQKPEALPTGEEFVPIANYLKKARKPFVQIPSIKLLGEFYSESAVKQAKGVFLSMNEKKRAYADNLRGCNQKIVVDSRAMTREEAEKITDEPNQVILMDFEESSKPFYIEKGGEVPNSFHLDIQHDEMYLDDLFGHHEISRGAGKSNTLGQDQMNFESDRTPVRFQSRATERAVIEMVEGWLQLMSMFYTEKHYARKWGERDGIQLMEIINEDVHNGQRVYIKPGSMIDLTKEMRMMRATQLYGMGALDPYTLFVELDMPNPAELADRLVNWTQMGIISASDPEMVKADIVGGTNPIMQSVERADQENIAFQQGDNIPPTPPEYVTEDHVKSHYAFLADKDIKLDDEDADLLRAHAEVDKATLAKNMRVMLESEQAGEGSEQSGQPNAKTRNTNSAQPNRE